MKRFYKLRNFAIIIFEILSLSALAQVPTSDPSAYDFPIKDPLLASILSAANKSNVPYKAADVEFRADRRAVPLIEGRNKIQLAIYAQHGQTAPLVFVIAGLGGDAMSANALLLASQIYEMGYHVVTLPNPMSWQYVVGRSESTLPGYLPRDSTEYYEFLGEVEAYLVRHEHMQIHGHSLVGYSYGGLLAGFLLQIDQAKSRFAFDKVVLINPAVDIEYGIAKLDRYVANGVHLTSFRKDFLVGTLINLGIKIRKHKLTMTNAQEKFAVVGATTSELEWVIGDQIRQDLRDIIFASQQIHDLGILKNKATSSERNVRESEAYRITFQSYMENILTPQIDNGQNLTPDRGASRQTTLFRNSSIFAITDVLLHNQNIYILDNYDDLFARSEDFAYLKLAMGSRLILYPFGGHMGNLWVEKNRHDLREILTSNKR